MSIVTKQEGEKLNYWWRERERMREREKDRERERERGRERERQREKVFGLIIGLNGSSGLEGESFLTEWVSDWKTSVCRVTS